jgi:hypothetical protein
MGPWSFRVSSQWLKLTANASGNQPTAADFKRRTVAGDGRGLKICPARDAGAIFGRL